MLNNCFTLNQDGLSEGIPLSVNRPLQLSLDWQGNRKYLKLHERQRPIFKSGYLLRADACRKKTQHGCYNVLTRLKAGSDTKLVLIKPTGEDEGRNVFTKISGAREAVLIKNGNQAVIRLDQNVRKVTIFFDEGTSLKAWELISNEDKLVANLLKGESLVTAWLPLIETEIKATDPDDKRKKDGIVYSLIRLAGQEADSEARSKIVDFLEEINLRPRQNEVLADTLKGMGDKRYLELRDNVGYDAAPHRRKKVHSHSNKRHRRQKA